MRFIEIITMSVNNNIVSFGTHHAKGAKDLSPHNKKVIASCRVILTRSLPKCFVFLGDLDDTLFKLADQAKNNAEQSEYFNVMRLFRIQKSDLQNKFTQLVLNDFDRFFSTSIDASSSNSVSRLDLELSLLQDDDLEEEIAITRIATKSNDVFGNDFSQLTQRFAYLIDAKTKINNPLAAASIATHLKDVISPVTTNLAIKLQAYKQFEQHAISELKSLCLQLNSELIKQQILPNLAQRKSSQQRPAPAPAQSLPESRTSTSNTSNYNAENEQIASVIFDQLRSSFNHSSLSNHGGFSQNQSGNNDTFNFADQHSILSALSELQQMPSGQISVTQNGGYQLPEVRQLLAGNLQADAQSVSRVDEDTINIIDLLFEFILGDKAIPAPIRVMMARLQIPLLKVAIKDKNFFSSKNHPARRLLNNLAKISTGWQQQRSSQQILIQNKIESVVTTILTEFDTDIGLFEELDIQLKQFIEQQDQSSTVTEQRIVKANEGQEKLIAAEQTVDSVISERLTQHSSLPNVVISLIDDGLKHVLKLRLLQKGAESPEWQSSVKLLEQLIWSVSPKPTASDRKELLQKIPHLIKELRLSLSGASFNQPKIKLYFEQLQACHIRCINGEELQPDALQVVDKQSDVIEIIEPEISLPIADVEKIMSDEEAMEKAISLKTGTWLEILEVDSPRQMKFSWRSNITERCLFVTYHGLKAADFSLTELAALFQYGQARVIEQFEPLMDRALVSMMAAINKQPDSTEK